jgi:hypothetical protein
MKGVLIVGNLQQVIKEFVNMLFDCIRMFHVFETNMDRHTTSLGSDVDTIRVYNTAFPNRFNSSVYR